MVIQVERFLSVQKYTRLHRSQTDPELVLAEESKELGTRWRKGTSSNEWEDPGAVWPCCVCNLLSQGGFSLSRPRAIPPRPQLWGSLHRTPLHGGGRGARLRSPASPLGGRALTALGSLIPLFDPVLRSLFLPGVETKAASRCDGVVLAGRAGLGDSHKTRRLYPTLRDAGAGLG